MRAWSWDVGRLAPTKAPQLLALALALAPSVGRSAPPPPSGQAAGPRVSLIPSQGPATNTTQIPSPYSLKRTVLANTQAVPTAACPPPEPRRIVVADESGRKVVARVLGKREGRHVALLPDGRLGWPDGLIDTKRPFQPATADELRKALLGGEYAGFEVRQTEHYLVFFRGNPAFAAASAQLLESLYKGLFEALRKEGIPAIEAEFPLVAVIDPTEKDFRARHEVDPAVRAFYQASTNRIFFFESSDRDQQAPEVAALRRPQTVAHEGTHQILQNLGVQPRLADWPAWLSEGLAEYCAPDRDGQARRLGPLRQGQPVPHGDLPRPQGPDLAATAGRGPDQLGLRRRPPPPDRRGPGDAQRAVPDRLRLRMGPDALPHHQAPRPVPRLPQDDGQDAAPGSSHARRGPLHLPRGLRRRPGEARPQGARPRRSPRGAGPLRGADILRGRLRASPAG